MSIFAVACARAAPELSTARALFTHSGGHSVSQVPLPDRQIFWYRNLLRYFRKHQGPAAVATLRACIAAGMTLRSLAALVGFAPQDSGTRQALGAYMRVLRECALSAESAGPVPSR
jgi:hypothetical protein